MRTRIFVLSLLLLGLGGAGAHAHAMLSNSSPPVGGSVGSAPRQVSLSFTQSLEPSFSSMQVTDSKGARVDLGKPQISDSTMSVGLKNLGPGRVKAQPEDLAARLDCQLGAWLSMGPLSSGVPMGASHGIGYVLGAEFGVPHGHTSCIMLPAVMRWNKPANRDRQALISAAMLQAGSDAGDVLDSLIRGLEMPRSLGAVKIGRDDFQRIAVQAMATPGR